MIRSVMGWVVAGALVAAAPSAGAQERPRGTTPARSSGVPAAQLPPPGMCRVWLDDVPAAQQPAPTDCASAVRNRPPNARIIFSPREDGGRQPALPVKSFGAPARPAQPERRADDEKAPPAKDRAKRAKRPDKPDGDA